MKKIIALLFCLALNNSFAQENILEKNIKTEVSAVTVFIKSAQVTRSKKVQVSKGKTILTFKNLSPFIDAKSIQIKGNSNITVLSVNHQHNFIEKLDKSDELKKLEKALQKIEDNIGLEYIYLSIIDDEISFLRENRNLSGKNEAVSVANLKEAAAFYSSKLTSLRLKNIERNKTIENLNKEKRDYTKQLNALKGKKEFAQGEIIIKIEAASDDTVPFELSYIVGNAGWLPSYDIRAKNVSEPIELVYKAKVQQDTKIDWTNVNLKLSSADPNVSGVAPELKTYYLDYYTAPPTYNKTINSIRGKVISAYDNLPLPGANVIVEGTTIGTTTDFDGNYELTLPNNANKISYTYIGFETQTRVADREVINVSLVEDSNSLDEIVIVGYGYSNTKNISRALEGKAAGLSISKNETRSKVSMIPTTQIENQTTVDYEIKTPYSIKSDNKSYTVAIDKYSLPAYYQYYSVPKINKDVFLIAHISDWEKYNLLEGEANIFFEDTYIGKSLLDVRYAVDTLKISLGVDKNVKVDRVKSKEFTKKQFIGSKKQEFIAWDISVKSNKSQQINMLIFDQIPVSTLDEIKIEVLKSSGAKISSTTGTLKWEFKLNSNERKKFQLKYSVKYPKNKNLQIE